MYGVKLQETQKVSRRKLPAGSVSSCTTTSQLDRYSVKCLLWHRLTFDSRGSCLVVIVVEAVSDRFSQGVMLWIWWTFSLGKLSWSPERRRRWRHTKQILRSICDTMITIMNSASETSNKLLHDMSTNFSFSLSRSRSPKRRRKDKSRYRFICYMRISTK